MPWPDHSKYPNWGGVIRRRDLDSQVADLARKQGAELHEKTEALPVLEDGQLVAVDLDHQGERRRVEPSYVVIADGSMNRFGRELGIGAAQGLPDGPGCPRLLLIAPLDRSVPREPARPAGRNRGDHARLWLGVSAWRRNRQRRGRVC